MLVVVHPPRYYRSPHCIGVARRRIHKRRVQSRVQEAGCRSSDLTVTSCPLGRFPCSARCTSFPECDITSSKNPKHAYVPVPIRMDSTTVHPKRAGLGLPVIWRIAVCTIPTGELLPCFPWPLLFHENNNVLRTTVIPGMTISVSTCCKLLCS